MHSFNIVCLSLATLVLTSSCTVPKYQPSYATSYNALLRRELAEALAAYETQGQKAEKNAAASWFPTHDWGTASVAYAEASRLAQWTGQLQKAIIYGQKALDAAEKSKATQHQVFAIHILIEAYTHVRKFDKARELIDQGLAVINANPGVGYRGTFFLQLGNDLLRRREFEAAVYAYSQSFELGVIRTEAMKASVVLRYNRRGDAYLGAGKLDEAQEDYQRAFGLIGDWGLRYAYEGELHMSMGEAYLQRGDFSQALASFQHPTAARRASTRIGDVFRLTGKPFEAIHYYERAIRRIESTRSLLQSDDFRQSFFEGGLDTYIGMIGVLWESGQPEEAFSVSERARSRAFLDLVGSKAYLSRLNGGLLEEERVLQEQIAAIRARLSSEGGDGPSGARLDKELVAAEQGYNAFLAKVRKQDKEQASLMSVEPLTLKQVQELIEPAQTLIEYFVTDSEVFVWVVEKDKLNFQRVAISKTELTKQVKTLREIISNPGDAQSKLNEVSIALYKSLIQPLLPHISGKELIVVPHDVLHYLPFQALLGSDGKYLIEKYPISYLSSASLLQFVKEKRTTGRERVLAFGNPDLGDPEKDLEFAELEAREVKSIYPEANVFVRKEATEEKSKALSAHHDILHFATHAQFNEDDPLSSAVLLAARGRSPIFTKR